LSIAGLKPFVAIYSTFLQRSYDEVITDLCLQKLPVVITIDRAGIVGEDGPTHHGLFDFSYLRHIPNITIMVPKDENELSHMLFTALHQSNPVAVRYPRGKGEGIHIEEFTQLEIGKAEVIREGKDLLIIAIGCTVYPSLQAAQLLSEVGIHATVINSRFVKPLDEKLFITHAKRVGKVITVEENVLCGGFGSAVLEAFERNNVYGIEMKRIGIPDEFVNHGPQKTLRDIYGIDANGIYHNAVKFLGKRVKK
ncbi:MAG: transketolase C-terminal domain-containing protein, partial [Thermodesulfobacteriota bacterium]|nr:transketolase C-terminal domain-containing protein [Thermodesulfobacteriota bacterium]